MSVNEGSLLDNEIRCESCGEVFDEQDIRNYEDEGFAGWLCADCAQEIIYDK